VSSTPGVLTITAAATTVTWSPASGTIVYGTNLGGVLNASGSDGDAITYTIGGSPVTSATVEPVGNYTITATLAADNNHQSSSTTFQLKVTPAALTVTANSFTRPFNTLNPALTGVVVGVTNNDSIVVSYATTATQASNVGVYAIVPSATGAALVNYNLTLVPGGITVVQSAQAITFAPIGNQVFSGVPLALTLSAAANSGLPVSFSVTGPATLAGNVLTITGPGAVTVMATQAGSGNYLPATATAQTFTARLGLAYGFYATSATCNSLSLKGHIRVDSFDSSLGVFPAGLTLAGGNIGTNGTLTLNGNSTVYGSLFDPHGDTRDNDCDTGHPASLVAHGNVSVTAGIVGLPQALVYPTPAAPSPMPPVTNQRLDDTCRGISGCIQMGRGHVALAPGAYGNLEISGNLTVDVSAGQYNLNSLRLDGGAMLHVISGPVTINLAGAGVSGDALDAKSGSIRNDMAPSNLVILYAGRQDVELQGGSEGDDSSDGDHDRDDQNNGRLAAIIYAPNANVTLNGGTVFYGTIVGYTISSNGNIRLHYDRSLTATAAFGGGTAPAAVCGDGAKDDSGHCNGDNH
jgi:hypothetical protein